MDLLYKTLKWPVVSLLITGGFHFIVEAIWPDLKTVYVAPVIAPLVLVFGLWVGYRSIQNGGTYLHAILAAAILGVLPIVLEIVGFGMILGHGTQAGILSGVFAFSYILFGSLIGAGFVLSREGSKGM
jgi:hypothetical protein